MRRAVLIVLAAALGLLLVCVGGREKETGEYLRIHIRADSNDEEAQAVKFKVRDGVVSYLTPAVAECGTKAAAMEILGARLGEIEQVADRILKENGFSYGARARLSREDFPTRVYEGLTLEAGWYDALILELGSGEGDNWWCVVYPPLCFAGGGGNVVYKSKIWEIIQNFLQGRNG